MKLDNVIFKELEKSPILKALICSTPEYTLIFDSEGIVQSINAKMKEFIKKNPTISFSTIEEKDSLCEVNILDNKCSLSNLCSNCMFQKVIEEVKKEKVSIYNREGFLNIKIDGRVERISIILNVYPFNYEGEDYTIFSFRDIEKIKEYERKRINDFKKLSLIGESVATIVHDLKNPLTGLFGYLELMKIKENKMELIPKMEGALEIIRTTLEDILGLTIEGEDIVLERKYEDIREMVMDIVRLLRIEEITRLDIKGKTVAYVDKIKFHNVFWNIIKNAYEALDDDTDEIEIKIYKEDMFIIVEILDNGKGIAEEHKSELFKPGKTFGKYNGTGFGLVNAKRIVEAHGGQIGFESELGVGTKFFVKIPNV